MNKVHNVIWSKAKNAWVVVADGTNNCSKSGVRGLKVMIALIMLSPAIGISATLPQGGVISVGEGTIVNTNGNKVTIKQTTDKLGVNWQSFNVGADGQVVFEQPNSKSVALNRVVGSDGSTILGKIDANGQVLIVNPNGVIFGKDAQVNVGGLVASTLNITDADFKNGNYAFNATGSKNGEVVNLGHLQAAEGGYVALLGKSVKNQGIIKARLGTAALAAGNAVTLDFAGDGLVNIQVKESAVNALVDNKGLIKADGGSVLMTARASNALLNTVVNNEGVIEAQTIENRGGKIFLDGGTDSGTVQVAGTLDVSAPVSGNGGFVETSGANVNIADGTKVTALAKNGDTGDWLVDPTDFTISAGSAAKTTSGIGAATLMTSLASANVALATAAAGSEAGDINVNSDVTWSSNNRLTLTAHGTINVNADINVNGTTGKLVLAYGTTNYNIAKGKSINLNGSGATYTENGEAVIILRTVNDLLLLNNSANDWSRFALAGNIDAAATSGWNAGLGYAPAVMDGTFHAYLNGLGHTISNLYINRPTQDNVGLIGNAQYTKPSNITVTGTVVGRNNVGLLMGASDGGVFNNVFTSGSVTGNNNVGGISGLMTSGNVTNMNSSATVQGNSIVGGVFGNASDISLNYLSSTGNVSGSDQVGGLVGAFADGALHYGYALGNVLGTTMVGGVVGYTTLSDIEFTYSTGDVTGSGDAVGGIAGNIFDAEIDQSFSTSRVSGINNVGGLAGYVDKSDLNNSYATGAVSGNNNVGGLVGYANNTYFTNNYSTGLVTSAGVAGGLVGAGNAMTTVNSFWDTTKSGKATSATGTGYADMTLASIYSGWSISSSGGSSSVWRIYDGMTGPLLRVFMSSATASAADKTITYKGSNLTSGDVTRDTALVTTPPSTNFFQPQLGQIFYSISTNGGTAIRNAGTYVLDGYYSTQFGYDITEAVKSNLVVNKAALLVSATGVDKTYDRNTSAGINLSDNRLGTDVLTVAASAKSFADKNAGAGKTINVSGITVTGTDAGNYTWNTTATTTAEITKAALNVTASGTNKVYDGTTAATATLSDNRIGLDNLTVTATGKDFIDKNVGTAKTINISGISVTGTDAGNYTWNATATATANITKAALVITATGVNRTYDATTAASVNFNDNRKGTDDLVISSNPTAFTNKNVGTGKIISLSGITLSGTDSGNYTWNTTASTSANVTQKALTVAASGVNKTYDGTAAAGVTFSDDRIIGDNLILGATGKDFSDKNVGTGKTINVSGITVSGGDATNYTWNTSAVTTADIAKAALAVTALGVNKTYDGTTSSGATLSDNRFGSDSLSVSASSNTFANKNAGNGKAVSVTGINVTGADSGNYTWNTTASTTANITKAALTVTAVGVNKTYDGTTTTDPTSLSDNRIGSDSLVLSASGQSFVDKNAGAGKAINVTGIAVTGADAGNYTWNTTATTSADIAKAALSVTAAGINKTYDGTANADVNLTDNRIGSDVLVLSATGKTFADKNVGTAKAISVSGITVTGADAGNYTWSSTAATTADITKAALNVTAAGVNKTYDGTTAATVNLTDDRIGSDALVLTSTGNTFANKNAGTGKAITVSGIDVTGADASNYTWNTTAVTSADIAKAALSVTAAGINKTYDGTTAATATLSDNRFAADVLVLSSAGKVFSDKNAGTGKVVAISGIDVTGADAGNYTWNTSTATTADIAKAALNVTASGVNKTYDGGTAASVSLSDNHIGADVLVLSATGKSFADKNAGNGKTISVSGIDVTGADAGNYTWNTTAATAADITQRALTVTASGINKTYDGTTAAGANLIDDRIATDTLTVSATGKSFADKNAGAGKAVTISGIDVTGADAGNYSWNTTATATADIAKAALSVTASGVNKTYDSTSNAGVNLSDNRISADVLVLSSSSNTFADKNAGAGKAVTVSGINVTGADANNYTWNASTTTTADIAKAALNVTATGINKTYDGSTAASANLSDDRLGADDLVVSSGAKSFADKNAGTGKTINVSAIDVTGADAGNYTWNTSASTTADIAKAGLAVTATGVNRTYDGTTSASVNLSDNRIGSDNLTLSAASQSFVDKNVGAGKAISISGINVTGTDAANYTWNSTATTTANITKAALSVTAAGANKTYDSTVTASAGLSDDRIAGDNLVLSSSGSTFADKNAGLGKTITVNGINVTGADAGNYTWNTSALTSGDIAKAALTITASAANKTYDASTAASVTLSDNRLGSDDLVLSSGAGTFIDKNAGTGKTVTVSGITVGGADAGNYIANTSSSTTADIGKAGLNISAAGVNKTYDATTSADVVLTDDRIGSDALIVSAGSKAFADKNAGTGKTISVGGINVTGTDASNYTWNSTASTSADIAKAVLIVTAAGVNKTYDGTISAGATLSDNRIGADLLVVNAASKNFSDKNAGANKVLSVGGITVTGADSGNYTWNGSSATTADISKAALTVTASGASKTYDGTSSASTTLGDDRIGSDSITVTSGSQDFSDKNAGTGKLITVGGITVTGVDAGNYTWNGSTTTTADITKAALNVTATGVNKTYDGTTSAQANLTDNRIGSDDLVVSSGLKAFADKNAGIGKALTVSGIDVTGTDASNYTWNTLATASASISKALLNATANAQDKTYDGSTAALVTLSDDRIVGDVLTANYGTSTFSDKNAGTGKVVTVDGITLSGADSGNYTVNATATAVADIDKANLVVKAENGTKVAGAADGSLNWTVQSGNLFGSDSIGGNLQRDAGEAVGQYGINQGSLDAGSNYALAVVPGKFDITAVVIPPIDPPVVIDPVPPVVTEPSKPVVNVQLEQTKQIVATISSALSSAAKVTTSSSASPQPVAAAEKTESSALHEDYRLLNLGMKLPDEAYSEDGTTY